MDKLFQFLPEQASTFAASVDALYLFLCALTAFFTILIFSLIVYFSVKYRHSEKNKEAVHIHGNLKLEILWTVIPLIICMILFVWGTWVYMSQQSIPANAKEIFVVGKQWMWKIQHESGHREINELHIPVDTPIKLVMTSEDVLHDFYIPAFRVKRDTVPGRYTSLWFKSNKVGSYHIFCAEYCGTEHSKMIGTVHVLEKEDFAKWMETSLAVPTAKAVPLSEKGKQLFHEFRCNTCHVGEASPLGPSLTNLYNSEVKLQNGKTVYADDTYLRESILEPNKKLVAGYGNLMPSYKGQLTEEQLIALVSYIKNYTFEDMSFQEKLTNSVQMTLEIKETVEEGVKEQS